MDTCPKCSSKVQSRPFSWQAPDPTPTAVYVCLNCQTPWFRFDQFDGAPLIIDIRDCPKLLSLASWINQRLTERNLN